MSPRVSPADGRSAGVSPPLSAALHACSAPAPPRALAVPSGSGSGARMKDRTGELRAVSAGRSGDAGGTGDAGSPLPPSGTARSPLGPPPWAGASLP